MASNRYCVDIAKRGTAGCNNCKQKILKGVVRIGKIIPNPFTDNGGDMKQWFHVKCVFDKLSRARATTKKIESTDDLEGWDELDEEHKPEVLQCLSEFSCSNSQKVPQKKAPTKAIKEVKPDEDSKPGLDDTFKRFRRICDKVCKFNTHTDKINVLKEFFSHGSDGEGFKGDLYLWIKLLLPAVEKRVYNLQNTELINLFSKIFGVSKDDMLDDFEQGVGKGDVSITIASFYEQSETFTPASSSTLYLQEVDKYLEELTKTGLELPQTNILTKVAKKCTSSDLKYFIRLIKHDLRINAGAKIVLTALHPTVYDAFQASRDLKSIVKRSLNLKADCVKLGLTVTSSLMTPVLPMLAKACADIKEPFKLYPKGFYVEIKYDGERVQIHKRDNDFSYFSRSLKPVMPHKVNHLKDYIPQAFPHGNNLILDCEILLVDKKGIPLPFGTLGAHRKTAFKDANVCLYVFDCLQFNEENIMNKTLKERRDILKKNMSEIDRHVMFSQLRSINSMEEMQGIVDSVIDQGLEGLVIKSKTGVYEPGKRHWLKLKKDYLQKNGKKMADSADLLVLGGYYGTGRKGGQMSVFLMGCYDKFSQKWCTVTKVPGGDDATLLRLNKELKMRKISKEPSLVPSWLDINKSLVPDFIIESYEESAVWEISGAEFSKADIHTAAGISIRFPRVARFRDDKDWETATTLQELKELFETSKTKSEMIGLKIKNESLGNEEDDQTVKRKSDVYSPAKKRKLPTPSKTTIKSELLDYFPDSKKAKNGIQKIFANSLEFDSKLSSRSKVDLEESTSKSKKIKLEDQASSEILSTVSTDLPNIFTGVKLHIPSALDKSAVLRRYFVAYDGELLKSHQADEATHVIFSEKTKSSPKNITPVTDSWLWDCIKLQKKLSTKPYGLAMN